MGLKEARLAKGLQQNELAGRMRHSQPNISAVENGHRQAWPAFRKKAATALKMSEQEIFGD